MISYNKSYVNTALMSNIRVTEHKHCNTSTVDLITETATKQLTRGNLTGMEMLDKGMISILSGMEQDGMRFHHITQYGTKFKTYELFISEIFHLIFLDYGRLQITETAKSKATDKRGQLCKILLFRELVNNCFILSEMSHSTEHTQVR